MAKVQVIALQDGYINTVLRKEGETFSVQPGQEIGVSWFRPVVVDSIPQGEVEPAPTGKKGGKKKAAAPDPDDLG